MSINAEGMEGQLAPLAPYSTQISEFLPWDVLVYTLDLVQIEKKTIRACMLTCKRWYHAARPFIYRVVVLAKKKHAVDFVQILEENEEVRPWIRELYLTIYPGGTARSNIQVNEWMFSKQNVRLLAANLPNLHTLSFAFVPPSDIGWFSSVRRLVLSIRVTERALINILHDFPHLSTLDLLNTNLYGESDPTSAITSTLALERLTLRISSLAAARFVMSLENTQTMKTLRSLLVNFSMIATDLPHTPKIVESIQSFLNGIGNQLVDLEMRFSQPWHWSRYLNNQPPVSLSGLVSLQYLTLDAPLHPAVVHLLSTPLPSLVEVVFSMGFDDPQSVLPFKYSPLDEVLSDPGFSSLKNVLIKYTGSLLTETVLDRLGAGFRRLSEMQLLTVVKCGDESFGGTRL
ncbi:hypothetical protein BXZ70DRAFT_715485 [Cristinia sonorae]|uniref:F-box domain-containing protein n=1 Tax=Cristinia sonorae TaxID=1940300 RepID=A0A8K0UU16_9AGAR|nr:hypothetical protein BXZ70DRAFT_715485 [Cristinia sonorae]